VNQQKYAMLLLGMCWQTEHEFKHALERASARAQSCMARMPMLSAPVLATSGQWQLYNAHCRSPVWERSPSEDAFLRKRRAPSEACEYLHGRDSLLAINEFTIQSCSNELPAEGCRFCLLRQPWQAPQSQELTPLTHRPRCRSHPHISRDRCQRAGVRPGAGDARRL